MVSIVCSGASIGTKCPIPGSSSHLSQPPAPSGTEDEIGRAVESHVGPVTLDLQRAEVAHMQTVQFLVGLADHLATQQRLLRIVYRSLPTEPDLTERILDDSGVLAHPNVVAVSTPT